MPLRTLHFCRSCLKTHHATARLVCGTCHGEMLPLLDANGALSREFLVARNSCCSQGCRNCPYRSDSKSLGTPKTCERCNTPFTCQSGNCWCEKLTLTPVTLEWLERTFTDCLCQTCLESFAVSEKST